MNDARPACAENIDDNLWHPDLNNESYAARTAQATYCGTCPTAAPCLEQALVEGLTGIWAGTTTAQRNTMRTQRGLTRRSGVTQAQVAAAARVRAYDQPDLTTVQLAALARVGVRTAERHRRPVPRQPGRPSA